MIKMEMKAISSASRINYKNKDQYHQIRKSTSMKHVPHSINQNMHRISKVMSDLVPRHRHFADDVNILEFTIEYLKQTTDFQRGVGFCAEETKVFLKQHIFDKSKINALFEKIQHRIDYISKSDYIETKNIQTVSGFLKQQNTIQSIEFEDYNQSTGVLLDLSMKQNRLTDEPGRNLNTNLKKREILDKIRKKILDKRDINRKVELVQNDIMWRPWRF